MSGHTQSLLTSHLSTLHFPLELPPPPRALLTKVGEGEDGTGHGSWALLACSILLSTNHLYRTVCHLNESRFSSASPLQTIDTGHYQRLGYGLNNPDFCSQQRQENVLRLQKHPDRRRAHPSSHSVDNSGSFTDRNVIEASRSPVTSI